MACRSLTRKRGTWPCLPSYERRMGSDRAATGRLAHEKWQSWPDPSRAPQGCARLCQGQGPGGRAACLLDSCLARPSTYPLSLTTAWELSRLEMEIGGLWEVVDRFSVACFMKP